MKKASAKKKTEKRNDEMFNENASVFAIKYKRYGELSDRLMEIIHVKVDYSEDPLLMANDAIRRMRNRAADAHRILESAYVLKNFEAKKGD